MASGAQGHPRLYRPLTDGHAAALRERAIYPPGWNLDEVLPNIPNPPSPFLAQLGQRIMLDVWGGQLRTSHKTLKSCMTMA